jgi:hypothetical protein
MKPRKLLFKYFNYPLFVPEQNRAILRALEEHGVAGMVAELDRLSSLGSPTGVPFARTEPKPR